MKKTRSLGVLRTRKERAGKELEALYPVEAQQTTFRFLAPNHDKMLMTGSGILSEGVAERGYYTATDPSELERLGFAPYQLRVPALMIPVWGVDGSLQFYRARPDNSRPDTKRSGRFTKYEQPPDTPLVVDVPPGAREYLADTSRRLWICEGEKKADSLVSRGECAVSLLGVWRWKRDGGPLPCWDHIHLVGREVAISFDSDAPRNINVRRAQAGLARYLRYRGAK